MRLELGLLLATFGAICILMATNLDFSFYGFIVIMWVFHLLLQNIMTTGIVSFVIGALLVIWKFWRY
jgi:hypothetical protein